MLLWPRDLFRYAKKKFEEAIEAFVSLLELFMGIRSTSIDIGEMWKRCGKGEGRSLDEFLHNVSP